MRGCRGSRSSPLRCTRRHGQQTEPRTPNKRAGRRRVTAEGLGAQPEGAGPVGCSGGAEPAPAAENNMVLMDTWPEQVDIAHLLPVTAAEGTQGSRPSHRLPPPNCQGHSGVSAHKAMPRVDRVQWVSVLKAILNANRTSGIAFRCKWHECHQSCHSDCASPGCTITIPPAPWQCPWP